MVSEDYLFLIPLLRDRREYCYKMMLFQQYKRKRYLPEQKLLEIYFLKIFSISKKSLEDNSLNDWFLCIVFKRKFAFKSKRGRTSFAISSCCPVSKILYLIFLFFISMLKGLALLPLALFQ